MNTAIGEQLDGRLFTDLSQLCPDTVLTPTDQFYIRTRASKRLPALSSWRVALCGPRRTISVPVRELALQAEPQGIHLLECAGNPRGAHFGMISVASWTGIPLVKLLHGLAMDDGPRVLVSGFDSYSTDSASSIAGASWVFSPEDLHRSHAFLATGMNGRALPLDHGAPLRLIVPGWYGCCCIKWVNEIRVVAEHAESTSQMREYASRTHQRGIPALAREYAPATIDRAAMPVRVEKWMVAGRPKYLVSGIAWGGNGALRGLEIQFSPEERYVPVERIYSAHPGALTYWMHTWTPQTGGLYRIRSRIADPKVRTRRLDMGYYMRSIEISDV